MYLATKKEGVLKEDMAPEPLPHDIHDNKLATPIAFDPLVPESNPEVILCKKAIPFSRSRITGYLISLGLLLSCFLTQSTAVKASSDTWNGALSNLYNTSGNWAGGSVPGTLPGPPYPDVATFPGGGNSNQRNYFWDWDNQCGPISLYSWGAILQLHHRGE